MVGDFVDAHIRARALLGKVSLDSPARDSDCIVIWLDDKRIAEIRNSRALSWVHADFRHMF